MDDAGLVRGGQAFGDLDADVEHRAHVTRSGDGDAFDVLHHQVVRADVVQVADVGVTERGDGARLAIEPLGELFFGNLDGDEAIQPHIACAIDLAHSARTDRGEDLVGPEPGTRRERHR